ncbi:MAG TPA: copper chaperone PCu(A)C [Citreicella sp.]|jgi:periplasmic copper chaperone A|uniref:Copper(I)-binding protein n=1 Tax=Salipiger marinus TaxID=555512 RepID=A0A1G8QCZ9_9RHOB|nr:copper chaperone PCu(A)C [Salipiger marinus]SDJ02466.1 hypothetical protein SAMN04487993_101547 [Salipiger marinus]HBM59768.1 copper chaperone PCu(A)C [Citreicella sp.]|tara:strand:+ start:1086 stop:1553 length:468 start_codon:yes stop_codon:yes gene_type:complete
MIRCLPLLLLLASPLAAHDLVSGDLHIIHPSIPDPLPTARSAAGYMAISNDGAEPEALIEVRTPFAEHATLHTTIFEEGVARMRGLEELVIPAGETVNLEPGGIHVMFMGLSGPADEGDMIPATLVFRNAGEVEVEFMVDPAQGGGHSGMDHSGH